jgi:hypothetical protein
LETFICDGINVHLELILILISSSVKEGNLKTLHIVNLLPYKGDEAFPQAAVDFIMPSVEELSIRKWSHPEMEILLFLRRFPQLRFVDLSYTSITGVVVKELMTREVGPLKWLGVNGCTSLSSDAVGYARSLGTVVEYNYDPRTKPARSKFFRDRLLGSSY